jgi:magnesium chelatase subunit I
VAATYRSRLTLVGSMNPEEGHLRPQIQDRFGLRVLVRGATNPEERLEIYRRAVAYRTKPYKFVQDWLLETETAAAEIAEARKRLVKVSFSDSVLAEGLRWIEALKIDSHRAEMTLFEAGRAYAAADDRLEVTLDDLRAVAPMALRLRQTDLAVEFYAAQTEETRKIQSVVNRKQKRAGGRRKVDSSKSPAKGHSPANGKEQDAAAEPSATIRMDEPGNSEG